MQHRIPCALLASLAGTAMAQPVVDGTRAGDENCYTSPIFVQTQPTLFGDNHPSNIPPEGDPEAVVTGAEFCIPLASLGNPGTIRLTGWINSGDRTFMSNQVIGGLPNLGNLGGTASIDFTAIDMAQFITLNPDNGTPDIDGQLDFGYVTVQDGWLQNNFTGFGDAGHGEVEGGGGSEIDAIYAMTDGTNLYLFVAGNVEANGNGLDLFFDTGSGGQTVLSTGNPNINGDRLNAMGGLTFESGFTASHYLTIQGTGGVTEAFFADLVADEGYFLGNGEYGTFNAPLTGADAGAPTVLATIDNSNTDGVIGSPSITLPDRDQSVGSEIDNLWAYIDESGNRLYLLVGGNLQTNFNKMEFFFDVDRSTTDGGQNPLRGDNVDIDFNGLNRMGEGEVGDPPELAPGLTFEPEFKADYWFSVQNGNLPVEVYSNGSVLRTDGPLQDFSGNNLDYGAYDGGVKTDFDPIMYAGTQIDIQDGFTPNLFTNYAPRTAQLDPFNPVPGLIQIAIDNSNIDGVTDTSIAGAADVQTGVEICIDLDELGWDGESNIYVTGFINNDSHSFASNQFLGGLVTPSGQSNADNLGEPRLIDLGAVEGTQEVCIEIGDTGCTADWNGDTVLDIFDVLGYLSDFDSGDSAADLNGDTVLDIFDVLAFLAEFDAGC